MELIILIIGSIIGYFLGARKYKFEQLHSRRLFIIEEMYGKLKKANRAFQSMVNRYQGAGEKTKDEKEVDFVNTANDFFNFLDEKIIFLNHHEREKVEPIRKKYISSWSHYTTLKHLEKSKEDMKLRTEFYTKIWKDADEEIPELIKSLEESFSCALGIE